MGRVAKFRKEKPIPEWKKPRPCRYCKTDFIPVHPFQNTCKDPACQAKMAYTPKPSSIPPRECKICGTPFTPIRESIRTCGNRTCVDEWGRQQNREYKKAHYIKKAQEKAQAQTKADKSATPEYLMPDPYPHMTSLPMGMTSWYEAGMMPVY